MKTDLQISDIILSDSDRLFIVDPECFIIFTGDSLEDEKPFIRIGNWKNLPVELIPLIENIIITDSIIGNPSNEQFNIDVRNLTSNRYIGSENITQKFLAFQRIFGLDLTNASTVYIEKDIPELSMEKNISSKDQYMGVFYRDGNFKVVHNKKNIIDVKEIENFSQTLTKDQLEIHENNRGTEKFNESGIIIFEHNPFFFHKSNIYPYLFPENYFNDFSKLKIDPGKIKTIIFPSANFINLTKFLKWKNSKIDSLKIYSDYNGQIKQLKKLFSNTTISSENFSSMNHSAKDGFTIKNFAGTFNLKLNYSRTAPENEELNLAYIKGQTGVKEILKENFDALIVNYSVYEDTTLLFKSTAIPLLIANDGNPNIGRLKSIDQIIINPGIQYIFRKHKDIETVLTGSKCDDEIISAFISNDIDTIQKKINSYFDDYNNSFEKLFNIHSLSRFFIFNTTDRKFSNKLKEIYLNFHGKKETLEFLKENNSTISLFFYNNLVFQFLAFSINTNNNVFIDDISEDIEIELSKLNSTKSDFYKKIILDRQRLADLLSIYNIKTRSSKTASDNLSGLKNAIADRKKSFTAHGKIFLKPFTLDDIETNGVEHRDPAVLSESRESFIFSNKKITIPLSLFLLILLASSVYLFVNKDKRDKIFNYLNSSKQKKISDKKNREDLESREIKIQNKIIEKYKKLGISNNIKISNSDIYKYVNKIAEKNGYKKISFSKNRVKNPNYIYPSNTFIVLDNKKVIVKKGDTLWAMAKIKLIEMTIKFNEIIKKLKNGEGNREELILDAEKQAFSEEHFKILKAVKEEIK